MARGKRSSGNNYTSKGERRNVSRSVLKSLKIDYNKSMDRINNQVSAWRKGLHVMLTIANPDKKETNKPYIRVNALNVWGPPRQMSDLYSRKRRNDRVN